MANNQTKLDNNPVGVRSNQNLSYNWLGSSDFGRIVPFYWQEMIGKDVAKKVKPHFEVQMLPFASPLFGKIDLYCHFFFVPSRLIFETSEDFFSQTGSGKGSKAPTWKLSDFRKYYASHSLANRRGIFKHWTSFGLPPFFNSSHYDETDGASNIKDDEISLLPLRAYDQIWWDFYRDPELVSDDSKYMYVRTKSGVEYTNASTLLNAYMPKIRQIKDTWISELFSSNGLSPVQQYTGDRKNENNANIITSEDGSHSQNLRRIEALTRLAERLSLSGKRQIDMLFTQYGIKPEFTKMKMAQYVGGGKAPIVVRDIVSSADTFIEGTGSPLGAKAANGYADLSNLSIDFTATEPGVLMGVFSIMPKVHFVQGLGKQWYRKDLMDFYRDDLEHVGQVAVPKKEISVNYATGSVDPSATTYTSTTINDSENNLTFAFTQPYYEYKRGIDVLAGDFMFYHNVPNTTNDKDLLYMQSMGMFYDYSPGRNFNSQSLQVDATDVNQVFFYYGGDVWQDVDDHFHVNIGVENMFERPMDGYAIPTLETTEDPHASKAPIGNSTVL